MPFPPTKPKCAACEAVESQLWRTSDDGETLCNDCYLIEQAPSSKEANGENCKGNGNGSNSSICTGAVRKSARLKPSKYRFKQNLRSLATKGKNRRVIFKKNPIKAPTAVASVLTRTSVTHAGQYYQLGDIVSVLDEDDGQVYYAQLCGFLQDQYMELSAVITWLLPTLASPPDRFDPATYILGPSEEFPRSMDIFEFVCHAPSEYFHAHSAPYSVQPVKPELGFVWTSLGQPEVIPLPDHNELFGMKDKSERSIKERAVKEKRAQKEKREVVKEPKEREGRIKKEKIKVSM